MPGMMGTMPPEMMQRMIGVFAGLPFRFVVNVGPWRDQKMRHTGVVRPDPVDEQEDDLVDRQPEQEGKSGGQAGMAHVDAVGPRPPLQGDRNNHQRHADL